MNTAPVADNHTGEPPLLSQHLCQQVLVLRAPLAVHLVVRSHQPPGVGFTYGHLKRPQVYLVHSAVCDAHVDRSAIVLLIVQRIVLQADDRTVVLRTPCVGHSEHAAQQRVFTQVLIRATARRDALDVDGRAEYHVLASQPCLAAHAPPVGVSPIRAPRRGQCRARREERGRVGRQVGGVPRVGLHLLTDAERSVGILHVGDTQPSDARRREHVLAVQHLDLLLKRHAADNAVNLFLVVQQLSRIHLSLNGNR